MNALVFKSVMTWIKKLLGQMINVTMSHNMNDFAKFPCVVI